MRVEKHSAHIAVCERNDVLGTVHVDGQREGLAG
jgi:hypothetical protein